MQLWTHSVKCRLHALLAASVAADAAIRPFSLHAVHPPRVRGVGPRALRLWPRERPVHETYLNCTSHYMLVNSYLVGIWERCEYHSLR